MKNILIRRVDNLGDMILMMPALKLLRYHFKNDKITLMVKPEHRVLVKQYADNFLSPLSVEDFKTLSSFYHHCINIEYSLPVNNKPPSKKKLSKIIHIGTLDWQIQKHISRHLTDGVKAYGINGRYQKPQLIIDKVAQQEAFCWLKENKIYTRANLIVSLDPNCGFEKKSWLLSRFIEVCKYLISDFNATIIIPAASASDPKAIKIKNSLPINKCFILGGKHLDVVAAVLRKCDLHIGNDSGIGHLAAAVNIPTVTIFGPTDPLLWKPSGKKSVVIVKPEINCQGGYEHAIKCKVQKCLLSIKTKEVIDGILFCLTKFVNQEKLFSLTDLKVSDHLFIKKSSKGYVLRNNATQHSCIVKNGWRNVKKVLSSISETNNIKSLLQNQPHQKPLIDMLMMHRVLEPS